VMFLFLFFVCRRGQCQVGKVSLPEACTAAGDYVLVIHAQVSYGRLPCLCALR